MASWLDVVALFVTAIAFIGVIYGIIYAANSVSEAVKTTKESLKTKGLVITDKGVSVKTSGRFDRDDYVDATQRGLMKAMSASSFGPADAKGSPDNSSSSLAGKQQNSPSAPTEEKKKGRFGLRRGFSGSKSKD